MFACVCVIDGSVLLVTIAGLPLAGVRCSAISNSSPSELASLTYGRGPIDISKWGCDEKFSLWMTSYLRKAEIGGEAMVGQSYVLWEDALPENYISCDCTGHLRKTALCLFKAS